MFGLMFIDIDSFSELKQSFGYGVVLHKDFKEEKLRFNVVVVDEFVVIGKVSDKMIVKRRRESL
jgi:DNA segregation ATPase FtsK/SpoIIIE-like protein